MTTTTQTLGPLQREWVTKLRSGQYRQTAGYLHNEWGYCCLGVALEHVLSVKPEAKSEGHWLYSVREADGRKTTVSDVLPRDAAEKLGLHGEDDVIEKDMLPEDEARVLWDRLCFDHYHRISLSQMNDGGMTFAEIADLIEAHPSAFFREAR